MKRCPNCNENFHFKNKLKACFEKNNTLICTHCNCNFSQSNVSSKMSFFIPATIYLLFYSKIKIVINSIIGIDILSNIINIIFAFIFIVVFVFLSQLCFKYKK